MRSAVPFSFIQNDKLGSFPLVIPGEMGEESQIQIPVISGLESRGQGTQTWLRTSRVLSLAHLLFFCSEGLNLHK